MHSRKCAAFHLSPVSTLEKWLVLSHRQAKVRLPQLFCEKEILPQNIAKKKKKKTFVVSTVGNNWKLKRTKLSFALKNWILTCWCSYFGFGYMFCVVNSTCPPYAEIINIFKVGSFPSHPFRSVPMMQAETLHVYFITWKWLVCFCLLITAL